MHEPAPSQTADAHTIDHPNQFSLLGQRCFAPFLWPQFSGAANDKLFNFARTVMTTYQLSGGWLASAMGGLVIGALFSGKSRANVAQKRKGQQVQTG